VTGDSQVINVATVSGDQTDPDGDDNTDSAAVDGNAAPDAVDDNYSISAGELITANIVTSNDTDNDGDTLLISAINGVAFSALANSSNDDYAGYKSVELANGTLYVNANGDMAYQHVGRTFSVSPLAGDGTLEVLTDGGIWVVVDQTITLTFEQLSNGYLRYTPGTSELGQELSDVALIEELDWRTDDFTYTITDGKLTDTATVSVLADSDETVYGSDIVPPLDLDIDGITSEVESVLASRVTGGSPLENKPYLLNLNFALANDANSAVMRVRGDLDGDLLQDGLPDAEQNAVTTFAWINSDYFDQANANPYELPGVESIVSLVSEASATSEFEANLDVQQYDVKAIPLTEEMREKLEAILRFTPGWSPAGFSAEIREGSTLTNIDVDPNRDGNQWRFTLDISRTGETVDTFMAFYKWIDQDVIDDYAAAGIALLDLDGNEITQVGWYDFTRRTPDGDGVAIGTDGNGVLVLDYIITDNSFGDSDLTVGKITDPGIPVFRIKADLGLTKVVNNPTPNVGEVVEFTLLVKNSGPNDAIDVVVNDKLPEGFAFVSSDSSAYNAETGEWLIDDLPMGEVATLKIRAEVTSELALTNIASVSSAMLDVDPSDNEARASVDAELIGLNVMGPDVPVSEGSNVVFRVALSEASIKDQVVDLTVENVTTSSEDLNGFTPYYFNALGQKVVLVAASGGYIIPAGVTEFYVAVHSNQDEQFEGQESLALVASLQGMPNASDRDTGAIVDDGTGIILKEDGSEDPDGIPDDDTPVIIDPPEPPAPVEAPTAGPAAPVEPVEVQQPPADPIPVPEGELIVQRNIPLQEAKVDDNGMTVIDFSIPADTFAHTADLDYTLSAVMVDGSELPAWLVFDAEKGEFRGIVPEGYEGILEIRVIARDSSGRQVETEVRIEVKKGATIPLAGKLHLMDQMQQDNHFAWKSARDKWIAQAKALSKAVRQAS
jgi:uncharacterized repeat protein (TIGR01451 family)